MSLVNTPTSEDIHNIFFKLKSYIEQNNFKGWDPYDGLESKFFKKLPFSNNSYFRIGWTQFIKRSPINIRKIVKIDKGYNPKSLALILSAYCNIYDNKIVAEEQLDLIKMNIEYLTFKLIDMRNINYSGSCWGYNFDWNSSAFFLPKFTPTVVCTSFVVDSLIKSFSILNNDAIIECVKTSRNFILNDLNRIEKENGSFVFSYSPLDERAVYNASLLGVKSLGLIYQFTKEEHLKDIAFKAVNAVCDNQHKNGAFRHSDQVGDNWRDNFHTGFKIECIATYQKCFKDYSFQKNLNIGLDYWLRNFFLSDGKPKYYDNKIYPLDLHTVGQMIPTLYHCDSIKKNEKMILKTLGWSFKYMLSNSGYFYFQKQRLWKNKIEYMRWPNAWMFYGISFYLKYLLDDKKN